MSTALCLWKKRSKLWLSTWSSTRHTCAMMEQVRVRGCMVGRWKLNTCCTHKSCEDAWHETEGTVR
jgi:hypothetical protein